MATYDELRAELGNLDGLYGTDGWRRLLSQADVRAIDGYLNAAVSTVRYEQSPTGQWEVTDGTTGEYGYLDPATGTFYRAVAQSTGDNPQVPDSLVGMMRTVYDRALQGGPLTLPPQDPFLRTDEQQRGEAAEAIKTLEGAMVVQQNDAADADLRLAEAVMRAHSTAQAGNLLLDALQKEIDAYIRANPGLDTPTGAREFQRFLNGVLNKIAGVVLMGSLDAASLQSVVLALVAAYPTIESQPPAVETPTDEKPTDDTPTDEKPAEEPAPATAPSGSAASAQPAAAASDPLVDQLMGSDPGLTGDTGLTPQTAQTPATSAMPSLGGMGLPSGTSSGATPSSGTSSGIPSLPNMFGGSASEPEGLSELFSAQEPSPEDEKPGDEKPGDEKPDGEKPDDEDKPADESDDTVVQLPNGDMVTAPNAHIASAITAAAGGTPVLEAYRQNGMTISPAGTPVSNPVDTADVITGDVGVFSDHHVIALGDGDALVNTAVRPVDDVVGPGFLGWERPPAAQSASNAPTPAPPSAPTQVTAAGLS